jgi:hypothetical protein
MWEHRAESAVGVAPVVQATQDKQVITQFLRCLQTHLTFSAETEVAEVVAAAAAKAVDRAVAAAAAKEVAEVVAAAQVGVLTVDAAATAVVAATAVQAVRAVQAERAETAVQVETAVVQLF